MQMKKLFIIAVALFASMAANALPAFYNEVIVTKGDYSFMQEEAKMWLYIDFTKAQLVDFNYEATKVKEEKGLYLEQKPEGEWEKDFEKIYYWTIKVWNKACDKRQIPLRMTPEKEEAKYALELYVDRFDYGWPLVGIAAKGEGATIDGTLIVRDLHTGETVYEAKVDRVQTWFGAPTEVMLIRAAFFGNILAPYFLGMDPNAWDVTDAAGRMRYKSDWEPEDRAEKEHNIIQEP